MTAEIAILNRHGVALAADSAMTVQRQRVWKTGNKLFSLSPANDIGLMIFGSGDFVGFSWEVVAKTFREAVGDKRFPTVSDCADEFVSYLHSAKFHDEQMERLSIQTLIVEVLEAISDQLEYRGKLEFRSKLKEILEDIDDQLIKDMNELPYFLSRSDFLDMFHDDIHSIAADVFGENIPLNLNSRICSFIYNLYCREFASDYATGVVIAGYGEDQLFPELVEHTIDGKIGGLPRAWRKRGANLNEDDAPLSVVFPFAQSDMFQLFMEGTTRRHEDFMSDTLKRVLDDKTNTIVNNYVSDPSERKVERSLQKRENDTIVKEFSNSFRDYVRESMVNPVIRVVSTLPKEEMAAMAEALVEITTLRRKVDSSLESVGGPTDVAIISKGDGLIWVKRKHYFDIDMNGDFLHRKALRLGRSQ